jgi:hypothetical protein
MVNIRLWKVTGPVARPTITSLGYPTTTQHWRGSGGGGGNFAAQVGTTNESQMQVMTGLPGLVFRNKKLWTTHLPSSYPATGTVTRSSIHWWQIDTLANPLQIGFINDAATPTFYDFSSIAVNDSDDALIGFGVLNKNIHPSCGYALHMHTDLLILQALL